MIAYLTHLRIKEKIMFEEKLNEINDMSKSTQTYDDIDNEMSKSTQTDNI